MKFRGPNTQSRKDFVLGFCMFAVLWTLFGHNVGVALFALAIAAAIVLTTDQE